MVKFTLTCCTAACLAACRLRPPSTRARCVRLGFEVEMTTVVLAFGVHEMQPREKEVFAFLPVRRYGLNFIVQVKGVCGACVSCIECMHG